MPHLLSIAPEIRQMIYTYAFQDSTIVCTLQQWGSVATYKQSQYHILLLVCKQIHLEADELYQNLVSLIFDGRSPWTIKARGRFLDDNRMKLVHHLTTRSSNKLLGHFPHFTSVCFVRYASCTWKGGVGTYDLTDDSQVDAGLKEVIRETVQAEGGGRDESSIKDMMDLTVTRPGLKVVGKIHFKFTSLSGDRFSVYELGFDFSNLSVQRQQSYTTHYRRTQGADGFEYQRLIGDSDVLDLDENAYADDVD